jgi:gliding motility-associated-like protein
MPVSEDVVITIERSGDAVEGEDYNLFENFVTIRIPAGQTTTTEYFVIAASIDDVVEPDEYVFFTITDVNSTAVTIGTGADVIILNQLPPVKEVTDENEANPAIKPDPLISPNGDGEGNDQFIIGNIESFPDNEVIIFNRWGNEVYRINGYNNGDKSFQGSANTGILTNINKDLPEGVYYYIIYTNDADKNKRLNKGYLILKR